MVILLKLIIQDYRNEKLFKKFRKLDKNSLKYEQIESIRETLIKNEQIRLHLRLHNEKTRLYSPGCPYCPSSLNTDQQT